MSAAATGLLPARDIMTEPPSTFSPIQSKRPSRIRLAELLKPSPPESRNVSPRPPASASPSTSSASATGLSRWQDAASLSAKTGGKIRVELKKRRDDKTGAVVSQASPLSATSNKPQQQQEQVASSAADAQPTARSPSSRRLFRMSMSSTRDGTSPLRQHKVGKEAKARPLSGEAVAVRRSTSDAALPDMRTQSDAADSHLSRSSIRNSVSESGLVTISGNTELERPRAAAARSGDTRFSRRQSIGNRLRTKSKPDAINISVPDSVEITQLPKAILSPREQVADPLEEKPSALSRMARRTSWIIGSRSPSPSNRKLRQKKSLELRSNGSAKSASRDSGKVILPKSASVTDVRNVADADGSPTKKSRRPLSMLMPRSNSFAAPDKPHVTIPRSVSTDVLTSPKQSDEVPEMPAKISKAKLQAATPEAPRKKDELWSAFRTLDADYQKFLTKPSSQKTQAVRNGLLPFLKTTADHASTKSLRADDLDKRINVLNKWWTGLLEILNGRNGQSVSPNDRPAVLEGVTGIMTRPEWRLSLSTLSSRRQSRMPNSRSASSLESSSSDFLAESVLHNVRNMFVQNLLSQMTFVVERMSMRSTPASIVSFCGKASAYAFFFCPGLAEIMVRLWSPSPDAIRRVLKEAGAMERSHDSSYAIDILSRSFPAHLQPLTVTSFAGLMRHLRKKPKDHLPLSSAYIDWNGPWQARWAGRDSDLFFVFAKTAIALINDLLPESLSQADWICVPTAALIQAQLLSVMDVTIHRGSRQEMTDNLPPPTFDDVLGADAVVQPLPPRAPNAARIMAENRLIMLLRECLFSPTYTSKISVRRTFAHIYSNLIKAAARRVSIYDHNACFTLCDFLDETIAILGRFNENDLDPAGWIDWPFWFDVLKKMSSANNTLTDVRLFTFVYGMWGTLTKDEVRRKEICLDWLLDEEFFDRNFNHWCPMVRAYYMRLLCWRIAREDGDANETNLLIYETLLERLKKTHSEYSMLNKAALLKGTAPPSTAPATPAPGRRLLIIRNDSLPRHAPNALDSLVIGISSSSQPNAYQRYSSLGPLLKTPSNDLSGPGSQDPALSAARKGWLRKFNLFSGSEPSSPAGSPGSKRASPSARSDPGTQTVTSPASKRLSTLSSGSSLFSDTHLGASELRENTGSRSPARASFKFSLEWVEKSGVNPRDRSIVEPQLPDLAQSLLDGKQSESIVAVATEESVKQGSVSNVIETEDHNDAAIKANPYCGRALAEWDLLIKECHGFYERRRVEGIADMKWMEIPTLGVESFRRPVG